MAKPNSVTARLRRTFHYPSDDDGDNTFSTAEVLDEQEQESLIQTLVNENHIRNTSLLRLLSALPLLSCIPFLLNLLLPPRRLFVLSLLGLTSLLATIWLLYRLDVTETGLAFLDRPSLSSASPGPGKAGRGRGYASGGGGLQRRGGGGAGLLSGTPGGEGKSPLEKHLPWLNVGLAVLALLTGLVERVKTGEAVVLGVNPVLLGALPGVVYAVVVGAKVSMAGVDPEKELRPWKYEYKGA